MFLNFGVGEDSESPLNCKEIQQVHPKGNQSWMFIGRTDVAAETPVLWPPDAKNWLIWKYPDAGNDWRWESKGMTKDEMAGWHHQLNGHGFEQAPGFGDGQGSVACYSSWGCKESDTTERLNWTELSSLVVFHTFFNLSLNFAISSSWSEPQSVPSLVFADSIGFLHLWLQRI